MKKEYSKPELDVMYMALDDIVTSSYDDGLTDGGLDGSGGDYNFGDVIKP